VIQSTIEGDQAAVEAAQTNLDFATVKAPFTGVVACAPSTRAAS